MELVPCLTSCIFHHRIVNGGCLMKHVFTAFTALLFLFFNGCSLFGGNVRNSSVDELKAQFPQPDFEIHFGQSGLEKVASHPEIDIVLNSVVGFAGLRSTVAAAKAGKRIALANKESMVAGGESVQSEATVGRGRRP